MTDVFNAIFPGFVFSQDFETDAGAVPDGAVLWLDLRRLAAPKDVIVAHIVLTRISATDFHLALTPTQTLLFSEGLVVGDFIQMIGAENVPLGIRVTIPVVESASGPPPP